jgi:hypothetical protein
MRKNYLELKVNTLFKKYVNPGKPERNGLEKLLEDIEKALCDCEACESKYKSISQKAEFKPIAAPITKIVQTEVASRPVSPAPVANTPAANMRVQPDAVPTSRRTEQSKWYAKIVESYSSYMNYKQGDGSEFECFAFSGGKLVDSDIDSSDIVCYFDDDNGVLIFPNFIARNFSRTVEYNSGGKAVRQTYLEFMSELYIIQNDMRLKSASANIKALVRSPFIKSMEFSELMEDGRVVIADLIPKNNEKSGFIEIV